MPTPIRHPRCLKGLAVLCLYLLGAGDQAAHAQFLRLGPLDFAASTTIELVYTTNVEGERESEAKAEREDAFIVVSLDLISTAQVAPSTDVKLDTGMAIERHLNRTDLDNSSRPFGRARIDTVTELSRYTLSLSAGFERTSESTEKTAFPGSSSLTRRERDTYYYSAQLDWALDPFGWSMSTDFSADRYVDEEDQFADQDDTGYFFEAFWDITRRLALVYSYDRSLTELINDPEDEAEWELTQRIQLKWNIWERPNFTYGFGYEKEDTGEDPEDEGDWEMLHTFTIDDEYQLSPTLNLKLFASYEIEEVAEDDDVSFTYGASLSHEISRSARQSLSAVREPVNTFGSSSETDSTTFSYGFDKTDLFIYNLAFDFTASYAIDDPLAPGQPTEKKTTIGTGLAHAVPLSRQLTRSLSYRYTWEDSNLEEEILDEHRVTLSFEYTF
jgi:hypothetical protein